MLDVSEQDILKSIKRDNPWWLSEANKAAESYRFKRSYLNAFYEMALNWKVRRSAILMGPRRVGKTVLLKQLIHRAILEGFPPNCIFFASIDTPLYSGMPITRLLDYFQQLNGNSATQRRIVILDEIQYLKDWETHLKVLTDQIPQTRFIASGSAAAALKLKSRESGAGRFSDFFLPPLNFAEFLAFREKEDSLIKVQESATKSLRFMAADIGALNEEFMNYLNFGGYPEAVLNPEIQQDVRQYLGRDIIDKVLLRDLPSLYGIQDIQELNRLFAKIAYHSGHEMTLEGLAQSSGVAKNTILKYLEYLEAAFLIVRVKRVDDTGRHFQRTRQFKAYLTNPSMRSALFAPLSEDDDAMGSMAETAFFSQWFHSREMNDIRYARWKKGRKDLEVDLVKIDAKTLKPSWAYEVKWTDRHVHDQPGELIGLIELAKSNLPNLLPVGATSKTLTATTTIENVKIRHFPCALHCYQIGKNLAEGRPP